MRRNNSLEMGLVTPSRYRSNSFSLTNGHYPVGNAAILRPESQRQVAWREDQCLGRMPYASLMAFVLCFIGVVLFSTMMIWSFNASVEQTRRALNITDIPWLDKVQIAFILVAIIMAAVALILLIFGILGTGSTREAVYEQESARRGGRLSCIVGITVAYLLNIVWMLVLVTTAIIAFLYLLFSELCTSLTVYAEDNCLDFSVFRPLLSSVSDSKLIFCGGSAQQFCAVTNTVVVWYLVGFAGSFLICLGLVQFIIANAVNYSNIKNEKRNVELRDLLFSEISGGGYRRGGQNTDFHVDYHPMTHHGGATLQSKSYPMPPSLTPQQQYHLETQTAALQSYTERNGTLRENGIRGLGAPYNTLNQPSHFSMRNPRGIATAAQGQAEVTRMRRNSYHNMFDEGNGWVNTMY